MTVHALSHKERQKEKKESAEEGNTIQCKFCGRRHERKKEKCPAYGQKCKKCGKHNHFATVCKTSGTGKKTRVFAVDNETEDPDSGEDVHCIRLGSRSEAVNVEPDAVVGDAELHL